MPFELLGRCGLVNSGHPGMPMGAAAMAFTPNLAGGSADLNPSTRTALKGLEARTWGCAALQRDIPDVFRLHETSHPAGAIYIFAHDSVGFGEDGPTHQLSTWPASARYLA